MIIFLLSLFCTLAFLYAGNAIVKHKLHQEMVQYAVASARESDGAENRVILNGRPGYLGNSSVYLKYLEDGWISVFGNNTEESIGGKLLSRFELEPGIYTLTGLNDIPGNTIALQLFFRDDLGSNKYIYQWDKDIHFTVERTTEVVLHIIVYPLVEVEEMKAQPAVYRDE